jgi:hypothetical protein
MKRSLKLAMGILLTCMLGFTLQGFTQEKAKTSSVTGEQKKRLELVRSRGPGGSLTILPVILAGQPFDRVSEVVGVLLEQQGLVNIELGAKPFTPAREMDMEKLASSLSDFVKKNPISTEYALYAEYNGSRQTGLVELRALLADSAGHVVWMDRQGAQDEAMQRLESKEPMTFSVLLAERLAPVLALTEETAKAAKPGKMARRMEERSGVPPENERAQLPGRQKLLNESRHSMTLAIYPVRIGGTVNAASASELATMINAAGLCKSTPAGLSPLLKASQAEPNEMKMLWDLAREFREYTRKNPANADYVLYADYGFNPEQWEQGFVHFVVCDRSGEWVIVDMQNSHHPDYQSVKPKSSEDCNKLLLKRLQGYLE